MLRASLYGVAFLLCVVVFATVRRRTIRQPFLLAVSYLLYLTWTPWFAAAVLVSSTLVNYGFGMWLRQRTSLARLWTGILFNAGLLGTFKYLPDFAGLSSSPSLRAISHLALPLGLSFWTFQAISYLCDIYREEEFDPTLMEFAIYMAFFPVTISGPICRMPDMLPQFRSEELTSGGEIQGGLRRIAIGLLMMQVAQILGRGLIPGQGISAGFDRLTAWSGTDAWCLAFGFGLQLFLDFAGYSHVAIGAARALGIHLPENFAAPFASTSPSVFWTRWHMSLSFWIRDYVFLPMAVVFRSLWGRNLALVLSMVVFGLWHKAALTFLLWGCYHGVLLVLHRQAQQVARRAGWEFSGAMGKIISCCVTIPLIALGWILFRGNSLQQARAMYAAIVSPRGYQFHLLDSSVYWLVGTVAVTYALVLAIESLFESRTALPALPARIISGLSRARWYWVPPLYVLAMALILFLALTPGASVSTLMYSGF